MATKEADDSCTGDSTKPKALGHDLSSETGPEQDANWMANLPSHLLDVPLHTLSIPGSHNSGAYELSKEWGFGPDADQSVKQLSTIPLIGSMAKEIIHRWSKCQNLSISDQLKAGVRYLDLRVACYEPTQELHFVHSLYGPKVSTCMEEVKAFLQEHDKEVVLLDFNHFYGMDLEHHIQLITYLIFLFDGMLCPYSSLSALTLHSLREKGTRVVAFYQHSSVTEFPDFWPKHTIASPWANTMDVGKCLQYQEAAAKERDCERFHVCQAVLTPSTGDVLQKFNSSVYEECARKINHRLHQWIRCDALKGCTGMIYIADFVEEGDLVRSVVNLNN